MSKKRSRELHDYAGLLKGIKSRIQQAQTRAMLSVNAELVRLYWDIGRMVHERQAGEGYGTRVVQRLARDLHDDLPEVKGFSERNIKRMLALHRAYPSPELVVPQAVAQLSPTPILPQPAAKMIRRAVVPQPVAQPPNSLLWLIPWGHHAVLLEKVKDLSHRLWYMEQTLTNGWSRNVLTLMIESGSHARQGKAITNFDRLLPSPQSDLAQQTARNGRDSTAQGAALGNQCETNLAALKGRHSLCGAGRRMLSFCAGNGQSTSCRRVQESHPVGVPLFAWRITQGSAALRPGLGNYAASRLRPHRACLDGEADLIHHPGKPDGASCNRALALSSPPSDSPICTRRMGSRRSSDRAASQLRRRPTNNPTDAPTIGLILCQRRNGVVSEYALRGMTQPIGVSQYELTRILPRELRSSLPSIDEIEAELAGPATNQRAAKRRPVKKRAKRKGAKS